MDSDSVFNSLKVSGQAISPGPVDISALSKVSFSCSFHFDFKVKF